MTNGGRGLPRRRPPLRAHPGHPPARRRARGAAGVDLRPGVRMSTDDVGTVRARRVLVGDDVRPATLRIADGRIAAIGPYEEPAARTSTCPTPPPCCPASSTPTCTSTSPAARSGRASPPRPAAAALGGVTTLVDMPLNSHPADHDGGALRTKQAAAAGQLAVDVGFWGGAVPGNAGDLEPLWDAGCWASSASSPTAASTSSRRSTPAEFRAALRTVAGFGGLLIVHAEDAGRAGRAPRAAEPGLRRLPGRRRRRGRDPRDPRSSTARGRPAPACTCCTCPAPARCRCSRGAGRGPAASPSRPARTT